MVRSLLLIDNFAVKLHGTLSDFDVGATTRLKNVKKTPSKNLQKSFAFGAKSR